MSRVIAWAVDASILCLDCGDDPGEDNDGGPVFSTDEHGPVGQFCEACAAEIAAPYAPDGWIVCELSTHVSPLGYYYWSDEFGSVPPACKVGPFDTFAEAVWDCCGY